MDASWQECVSFSSVQSGLTVLRGFPVGITAFNFDP